MAKIVFQTRLPRDECVRRLTAAIDPWWRVYGTCKAIGTVTPNALKLRWRISGRNSFQPFMIARWTDDGGLTQMYCRFRVNFFVIGFMTFWFGAIASLSSMQVFFGHPVQWSGLLMPFGMLAAGVGLVVFCRYLSRDEPAKLTRFVCDAIEAQPLPGLD